MTPPRRNIVAAILLLSAAGSAAAQHLEGRVRRLIQDNNLGGTAYAVLIADQRSGRSLAAVEADRPMLPASNMKLITTAAALHLLGDDFRFRTDLRLIDPGDGSSGATLLIHGDGDPGFGDPDLLAEHGLRIEDLMEIWVNAVQAAGVERVGRLLVDDRVFDRTLVHASWPAEQLHRRYCAEVAGVNFHGNVIGVWPSPTHRGRAPVVHLLPAAGFLPTTNQAVTDRADTFWVDRKPGTNHLVFGGKVRRRPPNTMYVTMHDPARFCARVLAERLEGAGISVEGIERVPDGTVLPEGRLLHRVQTTLFEVVRRCNSASKNLYAEALLKRMGRRFTGAPGSWTSGAAAVRHFLRDRIGPSAAVVAIADGSGLSRDNRVTARVLVRLLRQMMADHQAGRTFVDSLAIGGVRGTLRKRFDPRLHGRVYGKTGYINGVSTLSGYLLPEGPSETGGAGGRVIVFSLLFNDVDRPVRAVKTVQDKILELVEETTRMVAVGG